MAGHQGGPPGIRAGAGDGGGAPPEVISPELALVDPVAAAAARAALPEQPWDLVVDGTCGDVLQRPIPAAELEAPAGAALPGGGEVGAAPGLQPGRRPRRGASRRLGVPAARRLALMIAWAVVITALTLLAEVHRPTAPALGSGSEPVALAPRRQAGTSVAGRTLRGPAAPGLVRPPLASSGRGRVDRSTPPAGRRAAGGAGRG